MKSNSHLNSEVMLYFRDHKRLTIEDVYNEMYWATEKDVVSSMRTLSSKGFIEQYIGNDDQIMFAITDKGNEEAISCSVGIDSEECIFCN